MDLRSELIASNPTVAGGLTNIAFAANLQLGDTTNCVDLLLSTDRAPEAALFSRTFAPSQTPRAVQSWRKHLEGVKKPKQAAAIADPSEDPDEFAEGWPQALEREQELLRSQVEEGEVFEDPVEELEESEVPVNGVASLSLAEASPAKAACESRFDTCYLLRS